MADRKEGIYINKSTQKVKRIGIGTIPPNGSEWEQLSDDPNLTLVAIRDLAQQKKLATGSEQVVWE